MSLPNPPENYRVQSESGVRKLYYDTDPSGVTQTRVFKVTTSGNVLIGQSATNFIDVPNEVVGECQVEGQSGDEKGWGGLNNPPKLVDFGS